VELVDVIAVNKADGVNRAAADLAAAQYRAALRVLADVGSTEPPPVLTCSALQKQGVAAVWKAIEDRSLPGGSRVALVARRQAQEMRWLWSIVKERVDEAIYAHPSVRAIRDEVEQQVLAGAIPAEAAARRILEAFTSHPRI